MSTTRLLAAPAAALCAVGLAACSMQIEGPDRSVPVGTALDAFKRDLGLQVEDRGAGGPGRLPVELVRRFRAMARQADELLTAILQRDGRLRVSTLPAGPTQAERLGYARGMLRLGRPLEAEPVLQELLRQDARFFPALLDLGHCASSSEQWARAREYYQQYLQYEAGDSFARYEWARVSLRQDEHRDEAITVLEGMLTSSEDAPFAAASLSEYYLRHKRFEDAVRVLESSMELGDRSTQNRYRLGYALMRAGRTDEAREVLEEVVAVVSPLQPRALIELIQLERELEHFGKALEYYERLRDGNFDEFRRAYGVEELEVLGQRLKREKDAGRRLTKRVVDLQAEFRRADLGRPERQEALGHLITAWRNRQLELEELTKDLRSVLGNEKDEDKFLRLQVLVTLLQLAPASGKETLQLALSLEDTTIRSRAVSFLGRLGREEGAEVALEALEKESDPSCFRQLHTKLTQLTGNPVFLAFDQESKPEGRKACVEEWRKELVREKDDRDE